MGSGKTGNIYTYWEVFRFGGDGDLFEIIDAPSPSYIGKRVVMKQQEGFGVVMKQIGSYHTNHIDTVVVPHGSITGATFKRVEEYNHVEWVEGLKAIKAGKDVFVKKSDEYKKVGLSTDVDNVGVYDFDDLVELDFYTKQ